MNNKDYPSNDLVIIGTEHPIENILHRVFLKIFTVMLLKSKILYRGGCPPSPSAGCKKTKPLSKKAPWEMISLVDKNIAEQILCQ